MLTKQQKLDIIRYITGCSSKAIIEDVNSISQIWTEENSSQLRNDVDEFILECRDSLIETNEN